MPNRWPVVLRGRFRPDHSPTFSLRHRFSSLKTSKQTSSYICVYIQITWAHIKNTKSVWLGFVSTLIAYTNRSKYIAYIVLENYGRAYGQLKNILPRNWMLISFHWTLIHLRSTRMYEIRITITIRCRHRNHAMVFATRYNTKCARYAYSIQQRRNSDYTPFVVYSITICIYQQTNTGFDPDV